MKISISGPACAYASDETTEITDPETLKTLHGIKSDESCADYLDGPLQEIGLIGGQLEFVFDEAAGRLRIQTVYHSPRLLKKKELETLVKDTRGQWSDGIGEGAFDSYADAHDICLDPYPILGSVDLEDVRVEQVDDGIKVAKPKKSPLFNAVKKNDLAAIEKLLNGGEDLESRDRDKNTPLLLAVDESNVDAAKLLIARGAQLDVGNRYGMTPVLVAAMQGLTEILESLLAAGASPDYCDPNDYTQHPPLHLACNRHQAEAVRILVNHGATINLACDSGYTAIMHLDENDVEIARFLIANGADIEATNVFGKGMNARLKAAIS